MEREDLVTDKFFATIPEFEFSQSDCGTDMRHSVLQCEYVVQEFSEVSQHYVPGRKFRARILMLPPVQCQ